MSDPRSPEMEREAEIRERLAKAASGPWSWSRTYQIADADGELRSHWCLHNPDSDAKGSCIDGFLVLHTDSPKDYGDRPLDQTPNFALIANAPADLQFLLDQLSLARADRQAAREILKGATGDAKP